jgi:hypothetical protein
VCELSTVAHENSKSIPRAFLCVAVPLAVTSLLLVATEPTLAVSPESPQVMELVYAGLGHLEKSNAPQLGAKCLIGLSFLKAGRREHPRVAAALAACQEVAKDGTAQSIIQLEDHVYSNGIAIIFLCELDAKRHSALIGLYLDAMKTRQKPEGSWGYNSRPSGDTSQTQYGALAYWEAHRRGFPVDPASVESMARWLGRVQDPTGGWPYNGTMATSSERVPQPGADITASRVAASLGGALISADLFGLLRHKVEPEEEKDDPMLPAALQEANVEKEVKVLPLLASALDREELFTTIKLGDGWMEKNFKIQNEGNHYTSYYLYALERYKSFKELQTGITPEEPDWYNQGYEYLKTSQTEPGVWQTGCGADVDTAFSILFLLRSTQKAIRESLGEGTLLSGRGLPTNLARVTLKDGQLVVEQTKTQVSDLLNFVDEDQQDNLNALISDDTALIVSNVDEASARRLQQIVRTGSPEARILCVRALSRTGELDYVPTLIYALTDPDHRVVREADTGLRFVSRRFGGVGLPEQYTDRERYDAIDRWKSWFKVLRPDTPIPVE